MINEKLIYESMQGIDKKTFLKEIKIAEPTEYTKLLIKLRETNDLDFAEQTFRHYIYDDNHFIAEVALYSLGYLGIIRRKQIDLDIIDDLKSLARKKPLLKFVIDETIWEIKQVRVE